MCIRDRYIIASFNPIINWGKYKDIDVKPDNRNINLDNPTERKILERLLLCDIKNNINNNTTWEQQNKYEIRGNANPAVYLRKPIYLNAVSYTHLPFEDKTIKNIGENINNLLVNIKDSEL